MPLLSYKNDQETDERLNPATRDQDGFNEEGYTLNAGRGETPAIAVLIADLYKQLPSLEQMVKTTQQLDEGKLPDDLVKALFNMLGGNNND